MTETSDVIKALERRIAREQAAREQAELLLETKALELYEANAALENSLDELKRTQAQVMHNSKLESLGTMAGGIAHEINTPIQYVGDNLNFLKKAFQDVSTLVRVYTQVRPLLPKPAMDVVARAEEDVELDFVITEIPEAIRQSLKGTEQVRDIVKAMRGYAHGNTDVKSLACVNETIEAAIVLTRNSWKHIAELKLELDPQLPKLLCYAGELHQVILNLTINAAQAIEEMGRADLGEITIKTTSDAAGIRIEIRDDGPGIPENIRRKIFDPFFTTKDVGKGTGQGLAITHYIITEKHKGAIDVVSETGGGATFVVDLPINPD